MVGLLPKLVKLAVNFEGSDLLGGAPPPAAESEASSDGDSASLFLSPVGAPGGAAPAPQEGATIGSD